MTDSIALGLQAIAAERLGLRFEPRQLPWLAELATRRAGALPPADYLARLRDPAAAGELAALAAELTVGETYFFRHPEQFQALRLRALPALADARRAQRRLRALSAGCASGEEAWSLAICLQALLGLEREPWDWSVLGVDLNPAALARARLGRYGAWSLRELPEPQREPWLQRSGEEFEIDPGLRRHVDFQADNLSDAGAACWHAGPYELVFCRNVLMYLTPAAAAGVVARTCAALAPGGYLFLGHADTLREQPGLQLCHSDGCFYYRREVAPSPAPAPAAAPARPRPALPASAPAPEPAERAVLALLRQEHHAEALAAARAAGPALLLAQAALLAGQGRLDEAWQASEALLASAPQRSRRAAAHYVQGLCLEARAQASGAEQRYRQAARLDPDFALPRLRLGLLARRRGELALMRSELARAAALLQHEDEAHLLLFGGGFGRAALLALCQGDQDAGALA
jgi:chemotaxis protein methyltransferase CheR